ncbi:SUMF1/EgtB/PvdO family nonheme iron enzyme [Sphingomonas crocodyli]|uniref:SUMF1/EgtB/PvdO family nonheme iron enzyme n=1 Tax=Sphingomonas crocodyli TaxID=1979270 RepID=UPI0013E3B903|nr:SUMF1/EgtB/PvdO family nonheme iron enzyme [Sphingomonas crocodyli]
MTSIWAMRIGALLLWCAILVSGTAPASAAEAPAEPPAIAGLTLGSAIGGDKNANTRWGSNAAARYFIELLREKLTGGRNRLDVEMISQSLTNSQIRYKVTTPDGQVIFDENMPTAIPMPFFDDGGKGAVRQSLVDFARAYAEVQAGGVRKPTERTVASMAGKGFLGAATTHFNPLGFSAAGDYVMSLYAGGPAASAGLQQGDLMTSIGGQKLNSAKTLVEIVAEMAPGTSVPVEIKRGDQVMTINVTLGAWPSEKDLKDDKPATILDWPGAAGQAGQITMKMNPAEWTQTDPDLVSQCYRFPTTKNSQWTFETWAEAKQPGLLIFIVAGDDCSTATPVAGSGMSRNNGYFVSYGSFVAGGGPYLARISMPLTWQGKPVSLGKLNAALTRGKDNIVGAVATAEQLRTAAVKKIESSEDGRTSASMIAPTAPARARGAVIQDCELCPAMVVLPAGSFTMGSTSAEMDRKPNEGPTRTVRIANAFAMGKYEVTFDEWDACVAEGGCARVADNGWGRGKRPVVNTTWFDARRYVEWLSKKTGKRYFLPSEAEWEYAARARTSTPWNTGDAVLTDDANILDSYKQTVPVGGFPPNAFGLYDMHGNASEWTLDCVDVGYFGVGSDGAPNITPGCPMRAVRGGSFHNEPADVRSARRMAVAAEVKSTSSGFRVARAL